MENTEIMNNEVVEVAEEVVPVSSGNGFKVVGGVLAIVGLAYGGYKLVKKLIAKKKEQQDKIPAEYDVSEDECVEELE